MVSRWIGSVAVGLVVLLGATGCSFITPQGTTTEYGAGVGVNVDGVGPLAVRNVLIVALENGHRGNLIAAIVNNTAEDHVLHVQVEENSSADLDILVPAESTVSFGEKAGLEDPPLIVGLNAIPGSMVPMYFQAGHAPGTLLNVPVLDGCLDYLKGLEPGGLPNTSGC